jgi:hypothetical protein
MDMASQPGLPERVATLETAINTERPHLATKNDVSALRADMERQTRLLVMWFIATQIALSVLLYTALTGALG